MRVRFGARLTAPPVAGSEPYRRVKKTIIHQDTNAPSGLASDFSGSLRPGGLIP
jgi:hypothetical protein